MTIQHLQLFPLQTVLYPHCILPLHIFEPRYRTMIRLCIEHKVPFGVVQISSGLEVGDRARTYEVGTVAHIRSVTEFQDGRLFISTKGGDRFHIVQSRYDGDCLTGQVEPYKDDPAVESSDERLQQTARDVAKLFEKYWQLLEMVTRKDLGKLELPQEPGVLSWLVPSVLHVQPELKQALLQKRSAGERLELEQELLYEEVDKLLELLREANGNGGNVL
jgi:Lon protease-like protein